MTTTLVTGANKGLGKETARQLMAAGHTVWLGARDEAHGRKAAAGLGAQFVHLDVTDDASVAAAFARVGAEGGLTSWPPQNRRSRPDGPAILMRSRNPADLTHAAVRITPGRPPLAWSL